jgi:hypothetical protein
MSLTLAVVLAVFSPDYAVAFALISIAAAMLLGETKR